MTFVAPSSIPALSLSVHSTERLSTNTDSTMFSLVSEEGTRLVVMNLTALARGKYLRINMTSTGRLYLGEIEVFGTSRYTFTDTRNLHDMLTPLPISALLVILECMDGIVTDLLTLITLWCWTFPKDGVLRV